jgi:hypothetical protein
VRPLFAFLIAVSCFSFSYADNLECWRGCRQNDLSTKSCAEECPVESSRDAKICAVYCDIRGGSPGTCQNICGQSIDSGGPERGNGTTDRPPTGQQNSGSYCESHPYETSCQSSDVYCEGHPYERTCTSSKTYCKSHPYETSCQKR